MVLVYHQPGPARRNIKLTRLVVNGRTLSDASFRSLWWKIYEIYNEQKPGRAIKSRRVLAKSIVSRDENNKSNDPPFPKRRDIESQSRFHRFQSRRGGGRTEEFWIFNIRRMMQIDRRFRVVWLLIWKLQILRIDVLCRSFLDKGGRCLLKIEADASKITFLIYLEFKSNIWS